MGEDDKPLGITLPEDLSTVDDKGLAKLLAEVGKKFAPFNDESKAITADDLATMNALVEQKKTLDGVIGERATAAAQTASEAAAARQSMSEGQPEPVAEPEAEPVAEPEAEPVAEPEAEPVAEPEPVAAPEAVKPKGGAKVAPRTIPAQQVDPAGTGAPELQMVASSDIPGVPSGSNLDRDGLASALRGRARPLADGQSALVASMSLKNQPWDASDIRSDMELLEFWDKRHTPAKDDSLVASGGWCAPSEIIYDFVCDYECVDSLVDLPTVTTTRGGIRFPESPTLGGPNGVFAADPTHALPNPAVPPISTMPNLNVGFTWTEADDIAAALPGGPHKPCFKIPCVTFDECRLQAEGICVTAGNLQDRAYPELTTRYIDLVMAAHAHRLNAITLAKMEALSTPLPGIVVDAGLGAAESTLGVVEFVVAAFRDFYFGCQDAELEVVLPRWVPNVIRRDIMRRNADCDQEAEAQTAAIKASLAGVGAVTQFVADWQPIPGNGSPGDFTSYPTTVKALLYVPGTFTKMTGGSLDLGVVRDSTLNATNDFTAAWTEEFWGVCKRGCFAVEVTIPLCASGNTGAQVAFACPTV